MDEHLSKQTVLAKRARDRESRRLEIFPSVTLTFAI